MVLEMAQDEDCSARPGRKYIFCSFRYQIIIMKDVTDIDAENEISDPDSNFALVICVHFRTNITGKNMNLYLPYHFDGMNSKIDFVL